MGNVLGFYALVLAQIAIAHDVAINFDFEKPTGIASAQGSGFLHSLSGCEPDDRFVDPLKIKFWRGASFLDELLYQRLQGSGAVIQYVLSDGFQEDTGRWPHQDPALWEKHVAREATRILAQRWNLVWEPWNEPDFWPGQRTDQEKFQQYLDAFLSAYKIIGNLDPKAQFAGPSLSAGDWPAARQRLEAFLQFCAKNDIEITNLTWHGFDDIKNTHRWPERIREIRELASKKYSAVKVQRIVISEIVAKRFFSSPGDLFVTLKYLDDAGADLVGRTCHSFENCWTPTLDGSLVKGKDNLFHPTSIWWTNLWYASAVGQRYSGHSNEKGIAAAAVLRKGEVKVLLGFSKAIGPSKARRVILNLNKFQGAEVKGVVVERVFELNTGALEAPIMVTDFTITREGQKTVLVLPQVVPGEVYFVSLRVLRTH